VWPGWAEKNRMFGERGLGEQAEPQMTTTSEGAGASTQTGCKQWLVWLWGLHTWRQFLKARTTELARKDISLMKG
jgi:hypothetical protein